MQMSVSGINIAQIGISSINSVITCAVMEFAAVSEKRLSSGETMNVLISGYSCVTIINKECCEYQFMIVRIGYMYAISSPIPKVANMPHTAMMSDTGGNAEHNI